MSTKVAINGLGRIGRAILKLVIDEPSMELVAVNDLVDVENLSYLLRFDTVYGRYSKPVLIDGHDLVVAGRKLRTLNKRDPSELHWKELGVEVLFECTGAFTRLEDLEKHVSAGARFVLLSAPSKDAEVETVIHGVNVPGGTPAIISCASCTTNCITPIVEVIGRRIGFEKAAMTTVHAYTSSQLIVDGPSKRFRRGRAAAANLVPATTGAAHATTRALPAYAGRFDGIAVRAPIPVGSIADITFVTSRKTTVDEVNQILTEEAARSATTECWAYRVTRSFRRTSSVTACVHRRSRDHQGHRRGSGQDHELVRQRVGLRKSDGPRGGVNFYSRAVTNIVKEYI
jgi:glyceraldehyde 3-phosphate dehydrogenase (phosphorylating)